MRRTGKTAEGNRQSAVGKTKAETELTGKAAELAEQLWHTQRQLAYETNTRREAEVTVMALREMLARNIFGQPETAENIANPWQPPL